MGFNSASSFGMPGGDLLGNGYAMGGPLSQKGDGSNLGVSGLVRSDYNAHYGGISNNQAANHGLQGQNQQFQPGNAQNSGSTTHIPCNVFPMTHSGARPAAPECAMRPAAPAPMTNKIVRPVGDPVRLFAATAISCFRTGRT